MHLQPMTASFVIALVLLNLTSFEVRGDGQSTTQKISLDSLPQGPLWAVVPTEKYMTGCIRRLLDCSSWRVLVIGSSQAPSDWHEKALKTAPPGASSRLVFVSSKDQVSFETAQWSGESGRKSLGYLIAIARGARLIYETNDDIQLLGNGSCPEDHFFIEKAATAGSAQPAQSDKRHEREAQWLVCDSANKSIVNQFAHFGHATVWPHGFPIEAIEAGIDEEGCPNYTREQNLVGRVWIQQGMVNGDPGVDAIFRAARLRKGRQLDVRFDDTAPSILMSPPAMAPLHSCNTLFDARAFVALVLPASSAVGGVWRGYWAQALVHAGGGAVAFNAPSAFREWAARRQEPLANMQRLLGLASLLDFLQSWQPPALANDLGRAAVQLAADLADGGWWPRADAELVRAFVADLRAIGYEPPPVIGRWQPAGTAVDFRPRRLQAIGDVAARDADSRPWEDSMPGGGHVQGLRDAQLEPQPSEVRQDVKGDSACKASRQSSASREGVDNSADLQQASSHQLNASGVRHPESELLATQVSPVECSAGVSAEVRGVLVNAHAGARYMVRGRALMMPTEMPKGSVESEVEHRGMSGDSAAFLLRLPPIDAGIYIVEILVFDQTLVLYGADQDDALLSLRTFGLECTAQEAPLDDPQPPPSPLRPSVRHPESELLGLQLLLPMECTGGVSAHVRGDLVNAFSGARYRVRARVFGLSTERTLVSGEGEVGHRGMSGDSAPYSIGLPPISSGVYRGLLDVFDVTLEAEGAEGDDALLTSRSFHMECLEGAAGAQPPSEGVEELAEEAGEEEKDEWPPQVDGWTFNQSHWRQWFLPFYAATALAASRTQQPSPSRASHNVATPPPVQRRPQEGGAAETSEQGVRGLGVSVMNLRSRPDRREHSAALLARLGFTNVSFPETRAAKDVDAEEEVRSGRVLQAAVDTIANGEKKGPGAVRPYLAHAVDQLSEIRRRAERGEELFALLEDDLMAAAGDVLEVGEAVEAAIGQLPPSADLLFLECCFESCRKLRYHPEHPRLARLFEPYCTGAIVFTRKGARRVLEHCWPVFDAYDDMYHRLLRDGTLEAYLAIPPPFVQDFFWGTDANRTFNLEGQTQAQPTRHGMYAPACNEFQHRQLAQEAHVVNRSLLPAWAMQDGLVPMQGCDEAGAACDHGYAVLEDPLNSNDALEAEWRRVLGAGAGWGLACYTRGRGRLAEVFAVEVGRWHDRQGGAVLKLWEESQCWPRRATSPLCEVEFALLNDKGDQVAARVKFVYLHWPQPYTPDGLRWG